MPIAVGKIVQNDRVVGTFFAISVNRGVTAFHCIGDRHSGKVWDSLIRIDFSGASLSASYEFGNPQRDFAILRLEKELPNALTPIPLLQQVYPQARFRAVGFPSNVSGADQVAISGYVTNPDATIFKGVSAIQLSSPESAAGMELQGLSGAPVLVGNPEASIGLIRWNPTKSQNSRIAQGGIVFACPAAALLESAPQLASCFQAEISNLEMTSAPAIASAHSLKPESRTRILEANRSYWETLESEWVPVPIATNKYPLAAIPRSRLGEFFQQAFRGNLYAIALSLFDTVPKHLAEIQFAILARFDADEDHFQITIVVPQFDLLATVMRYLPPQGSVAKLLERVKEANINIELRCTFLLGKLVPLVIVYRPMFKKVIFANMNQIKSPGQFLSPYKCDTTSGFLNFIGTLSLHQSESPEHPQIVLFENLDTALASIDNPPFWLWFMRFVDTGLLFSGDSLFVNTRNPERWRYDYPQAVAMKDN